MIDDRYDEDCDDGFFFDDGDRFVHVHVLLFHMLLTAGIYSAGISISICNESRVFILS